MTVTATLIFHGARHVGWSQREMSCFQKAATRFSSDGIDVEIDFGVTDEGEPWLVFVEPHSNELVGHFARISDKYVACVPFCDDGLTGYSLSELLVDFQHRRRCRTAAASERLGVSLS